MGDDLAGSICVRGAGGAGGTRWAGRDDGRVGRDAEEGAAGLVVARFGTSLAIEEAFQAGSVELFAVEERGVQRVELFAPGVPGGAVVVTQGGVDVHHGCCPKDCAEAGGAIA